MFRSVVQHYLYACQLAHICSDELDWWYPIKAMVSVGRGLLNSERGYLAVFSLFETQKCLVRHLFNSLRWRMRESMTRDSFVFI